MVLQNLNKKQRAWLQRILIALVLLVACILMSHFQVPEKLVGEQAAVYLEFVLFLVPYLIAGYDVLLKAARNIGHGQVFDENFLMSIASLGAFALVFFPESEPHFSEGAAVMIFYQVGELFQSYAVSKSRKSIANMMDIAPLFATVKRNGVLEEVDPGEVLPGEVIVVKPGEKIALDGVVLEGSSQLDTSALTGESQPRSACEGDEVISGCINLRGALSIKVTKPYEESTVARILELVESASERKARTENFITRFARYYTPAVVTIALLLAVLPPLLAGLPWNTWIERGLIFLVVSCPCALVISVPLSFFGGIGGASRHGILVKGGNYLEALAQVDTVAFDKTGTLTCGTFEVIETIPAGDMSTEVLLDYAAHAESMSTHPLAVSIRKAYGLPIASERITDAKEQGGYGVEAIIDGQNVLVGSHGFLMREGIEVTQLKTHATVVYVAVNRVYAGAVLVADEVKPSASQAIEQLHGVGIQEIIMLTGDRGEVAEAIAKKLDIDSYYAELLPQQKVEHVERLIAEEQPGKALAFVGDGINDAPVLMRADVGIAMGALGSDAAIEAADVVLMDDNPTKIAVAVKLAQKTMRIVRENIIFALTVKFLVLILAAVGIANMWLAVFADVGVAILAIINAMRCMRL
ncbi:MAG: cadmium-translocating P-type ATPase [Coriobacteriales bacterium]|nr:cadmium-translocating P-type ATPase [Coriobacteriales bacterium]